MANSIDPRATPGAGSTHPVQQQPSAPATGQCFVLGAQAVQSIASAGVAPLSAARVAPGSANPRIAVDAARISQAVRPAVFCVSDLPQGRSLGLAPRQAPPGQRVPTPPPHLVGDPSKPYAFDPRAQTSRDFQTKRSPSP